MSDIFLPVILMLENDPDDRFITSTVFEEQQYQAHLEFVNNSKGLFAYLDQCRLSNLSYPAVILINLNITPIDGREVLKQLKANMDYRHLPVVIISDSNDPKIARECYTLGASSFIQKPDALSRTNEKIHHFFKYWFETVVLS
ncbi:response regulator [Chitinophaga filiformis]|uniref:Response regulator receiver domain-containing protein n=1 Tax=Chitinophaga filiformis TaxID=104663 RepID=A0A1G8BS81_CHIFI|nr:response regulator [Chitinophaga filiformis]SDH36032.1 Response regulator receiver domain-containing protein [Chitinophaga filiformis]